MVRAEKGKLFVAERQEGQLLETELVDLNSYEPAPQEAPTWARVWD
jgi:hypothetical protein